MFLLEYTYFSFIQRCEACWRTRVIICIPELVYRCSRFRVGRTDIKGPNTIFCILALFTDAA